MTQWSDDRLDELRTAVLSLAKCNLRLIGIVAILKEHVKNEKDAADLDQLSGSIFELIQGILDPLE